MAQAGCLHGEKPAVGGVLVMGYITLQEQKTLNNFRRLKAQKVISCARYVPSEGWWRWIVPVTWGSGGKSGYELEASRSLAGN